MCIFSGDVHDVKSTKIFLSGVVKKVLVYQMSIGEDHGDVAMILPVPTLQRPDSSPSLLHFINMQEYPEFFSDLDSLFPKAKSLRSRGGSDFLSIPVHEVGDFIASFVPSIKQFSNLNECFRLPENVWSQLPNYQDYGFAVFQLKAGITETKQPMAFDYIPQDPNLYFFPTIHVHDGRVSDASDYDHELFFQDLQSVSLPKDWQKAEQLPGNLLQKAAFVSPTAPIYRRTIRGRFPNQDVTLLHKNLLEEKWMNGLGETGAKVRLFRLGDPQSEKCIYAYSTLKNENGIRNSLGQQDPGGMPWDDFCDLLDNAKMVEIKSIDEVPMKDRGHIPYCSDEFVEAWEDSMTSFDLTVEDFFAREYDD